VPTYTRMTVLESSVWPAPVTIYKIAWDKALDPAYRYLEPGEEVCFAGDFTGHLQSG